MTDPELGDHGRPLVHEHYVCPRCNGRGRDPYVQPRQSCVICWGEGTAPAWEPAWESQHGLLVRELLARYGSPATKMSDEPPAES